MGGREQNPAAPRFLAPTLHNLATLYLDQGKYDQAEVLYKRVVAIREIEFGPDHPSLATSLEALAWVEFKRGKPAEARTKLERAMAIYERALGPDHPALVPVLTDLGRVYESIGDLAACGPVLDRIRALNVRAHGDGGLVHASDLTAASNLARLQGDGERAEALARRALAVAQAVLPDGTMVDDFDIVHQARALHVLNAPSPAATASLAIGDHIAALFDKAMADVSG